MRYLWMCMFVVLSCLFVLPATAMECANCHDPGMEIVAQIDVEQDSNDLTTTNTADSLILITDSEGNESLYMAVDSSSDIDYLVDVSQDEGEADSAFVIRVQEE